MAFSFPPCHLEPLPDAQVAFYVQGHERVRWHFGQQYPRPFLFPLIGPSGTSLTRMGHPGAPDHDHHRSVWLAHHKVMGVDFWSDQSAARIRQTRWLAYRDGEEAVMAVQLAWHDGHDPPPLLEQQLVVAVRPGPGPHETLVELSSTFTPLAEMFEFGQTNFGFLAVRVAAHLSAHFGGGQLTDSEGRVGETAIFGRKAAWVDYSGPAPANDRQVTAEGITYFNHPTNPQDPVTWHVRDDGWMGASVCFDGPVSASRSKPLHLRYLLDTHSGMCDAVRAAELQRQFAAAPDFSVNPSNRPHRAYEVGRQEVGRQEVGR